MKLLDKVLLIFAIEIMTLIATVFIGNFFFTQTHEEIHSVIYYEVGGVNSTIHFGPWGISAFTSPDPNATVQNPILVQTLQGISELYQYQTLTVFFMTLFMTFLFSSANLILLMLLIPRKNEAIENDIKDDIKNDSNRL